MGCGASAQKYQKNSLNSLDEERKPLRPPGGHNQIIDDEQQPLHRASDPPSKPAVQQAERYRPVDAAQAAAAVDGGDAVEENMKMSLAIAAANDENLLRKYADNLDKKRRPGAGKRVFAPDSGPLSGELLRNSHRQNSSHSSTEDFQTLPNHTVGGFRMQHKHLSSPHTGGVKGCLVR